MNILKASYAALLLMSLTFTSCDKETNCKSGSGGIVTRTLEFPAFTSIDFQEAGEVIISQGPEQEVVAVGDANVVSDLNLNVDNGLWEIEFDDRCYKNYELTIHITVPNLKAAYLSGSGSITINDFEDQTNLSLVISGSGTTFLSAFDGPENLYASISGSGNIITSADIPSLKFLDVSISGSGTFEGFPVITDECDVDISGSGNCQVNVNDKLDVHISGSGSVFYKGTPTLNTHITGSGVVINAN